MNRRLFLSLLAMAAFPPAAIAGVETATPADSETLLRFAPRGVVVEMPSNVDTFNLLPFGRPLTPEAMNVQMISTGRGWVLLESDEGQAIARENALLHRPANLRSDGTIRGRQHHPVDFPPRR